LPPFPPPPNHPYVFALPPGSHQTPTEINLGMKGREPIKFLVVDDHPAFRIGLTALIESQEDMKVVAETGNGREAVELFRKSVPDVVLMDLRLPGFGGVEAITALRREFPRCRVVVITTYDCDEDIYRAYQAGACACLLKDSTAEEIIHTLRKVNSGEKSRPPGMDNRLRERRRREELSDREMDVLRCLVKGCTNKEIADRLFISEDTVKTHLKNLFAKLGVPDRTGAVIAAVRHGIVHLE
jgi:DNA-binding NarL/FixJ family response regulator